MNNTINHAASRTALTLMVLALLLGAAGCAPASVQQADQKQVDKIAATIADFTVPAGFSKSFAAHLMDYSLVGYIGEDGHSHIYLCQLEAGDRPDQAEIEKLLGQVDANTESTRQQYRVTGSRPAQIMGQDVELVIVDGTNHDGSAYRQVTGLFEGRGGPVLVVFERPMESWDEAELSTFLASIH